MKENIIEIFSSAQGEGPYVGTRQVFVRFEGCNLGCRYCDTEHKPGTHPCCRLETSAGSGRFRTVTNPLSAAEVARAVNDYLEVLPHQAVSFTGGEPLLHTGFLLELAQQLPVPVFLETNGTLPRELATILSAVQIISMDMKLPSVTGKVLWDEHRAFLDIAREKDVYVKIVVTSDTPPEELLTAARLIRDTAPETPLILQPVTPANGCLPPRPQEMLRRQQECLSLLFDVRIIPQTHVMIGQL